jgi:hypothetical protein
MREITLTPVLTEKQLAALDNQFLTSAQVFRPITMSTIGRTEDRQISFVFARNVIKQAVRDLAASAIGRVGYSAKQSNRAAVRGQDGTEALWGFMEANDFRPEAGMTALTLKHLDLFIEALPFITSVDQAFRNYWPAAYEFQQRLAETTSELVIPGTGFSSLTINGNVITRVHRDEGNAVGTVSCLTQLGKFSGGHICIPRFGVLIESQPGDLLIAAIRDEPHGNIGPVIGERIACVFYLREGALTRPPSPGSF